MNLKRKDILNVREKILSEKYGKFDLIEQLFPIEELIKWPPRIVLQRIVTELSLDPGTINKQTFYSWLRRYKQRKGSAFYPEQKPNNQASEEWRSFKPSNIDSLKDHHKKSIIQVVK